jgi:hypothetical protein
MAVYDHVPEFTKEVFINRLLIKTYKKRLVKFWWERSQNSEGERKGSV